MNNEHTFKSLCESVYKISQLIPELSLTSGDLLTNYT